MSTNYIPEDYSQAATNRGQRQINFALTLVDERLVKALREIRHLFESVPGHPTFDFAALDAALAEASRLNERVAGIKPPGCDETWT